MAKDSSPTDTGPWGAPADVVLSLLPILLLLVLTLKPRPAKTTFSLPLAALVMWAVRVAYFSSDANQVNAAVVRGLFDSLTPLAIVFGAMSLFEVMELTGCLSYIVQALKAISAGNVSAEVFLIGWAFVYLIEGASGFGTPTALAAPMLVQLGHDETIAVSSCLIMNTLPTVFGAVGTPIWFGLAGLGLDSDEQLQISWKCGLILMVSVHVIPLLAASHLVEWDTIRRNIVFIMLSIYSAAVPAFVLSFFTTEFPALLGGAIGCILTGLLVKYKIGLAKDPNANRRKSKGPAQLSAEMTATKLDIEARPTYVPAATAAAAATSAPSSKSVILTVLAETFPLWGTVLLLALTRVEQFGIKEYIQREEPSAHAQLGSFATFHISPSFVVRLEEIFREPAISWKFELLFTPFILPFLTVGFCTMVLFRDRLPKEKGFWGHVYAVLAKVFRRVVPVAQALAGALVLVALLRLGGQGSPAYSIGYNLSELLQDGWIVLAPFLGTLGAFFSGSTTVSNLTFGAVQQTAAKNLGVSVTSMLAVQAIGAASGNMVCLNNIIAGKAVVGGAELPEADFIVRTYKPMLVFSLITAVVGSILLYAV